MNFLKRITHFTSTNLSRLWNRQVLVFCFFLALSTFFWIFMAGKERKEVEFDVQVSLINVPDNVVITTEPPKKVTLKLKDEVFTLFNYKYNKKKNFHITLDWNEVNTPSGHVRLLSSNLLKNLTANLQHSTEIIGCRPDTIEFFYNYGQSRTVPVVFQGCAEADSAYNIISRDIYPRQVVVYASKRILDTITAAYIKPVALYDLADTTVVNVEFQKVNGIKYVPNSARLTVIADRMVEKTVDVPVRGVNFPAGKSLRTFPAKVAVNFQVGTSFYNKVDAESFVIVVNYEDLVNDNDNKVVLHLKSTPYGVQRPRINPSEVEYIIEDTAE